MHVVVSIVSMAAFLLLPWTLFKQQYIIKLVTVLSFEITVEIFHPFSLNQDAATDLPLGFGLLSLNNICLHDMKSGTTVHSQFSFRTFLTTVEKRETIFSNENLDIFKLRTVDLMTMGDMLQGRLLENFNTLPHCFYLFFSPVFRLINKLFTEHTILFYFFNICKIVCIIMHIFPSIFMGVRGFKNNAIILFYT